MASYSVEWMISMLALVGCVLVGTVASDDQALEALKSQLKPNDITFEQIDSLLQNYEHPEDVLKFNIKVGELAETCKMSVSKCSYDGYMSIYSLVGSFPEYPQLNAYMKDCMHVKVKNYCSEHIDEVAKNLVDSISAKDKELVQLVVEPLKEGGVLDLAPDSEIPYWLIQEEEMSYFDVSEDVENYFKDFNKEENDNEQLYAWIQAAYNLAKYSKFGDNPSAEQEKQLLKDVFRAFVSYENNYAFLRELTDNNKEGPKPSNALVTDLYKTGRIAAHFNHPVLRRMVEKLNERIESFYE